MHDLRNQGHICVVLTCFLAVSCLAQKSLRLVSVENLPPRAPVRVGAIYVAGSRIRDGIPFEASSNWIDDMIVTIDSQTSKTIIGLDVWFDFPDSGPRDKTSPPLMYQLRMGRSRVEDVKPAERELPHTDGTVTLDIHLHTYSDYIKQLFAATKYSLDQDRCKIIIGAVMFADGTKWTTGGSENFYREDTRTGKYDHISAESFYSAPELIH